MMGDDYDSRGRQRDDYNLFDSAGGGEPAYFMDDPAFGSVGVREAYRLMNQDRTMDPDFFPEPLDVKGLPDTERFDPVEESELELETE